MRLHGAVRELAQSPLSAKDIGSAQGLDVWATVWACPTQKKAEHGAAWKESEPVVQKHAQGAEA